MKRSWLLFILCLALSFVSCNKKNDNIITYTSDDIYLNFVECGHISGFPKELLIFETGEQLEYALKEYEGIASLPEFDAVTEEYPIGEYIYLLQYFDTDIDSKVECKGLNVNKEEMWIRFEHEIKSPKEGPAAIAAYVTYAALPKEYLDGCDFSNQQGVLYLGNTADIYQTNGTDLENENQGNEQVAARDLNGLEIIIGDTYSPEVTPVPMSTQERVIQQFRDEAMQTYNFTIRPQKVADWEEMQEVYISSVESGKPVAQVFEMDYRFIAKPLSQGLFYDLAALEDLDFTNFFWSDSVREVMTKGDCIYGMCPTRMEPGGGLLWNKRLFKEAGLDPDLPYDLQACGEWTWSKYEELCALLTRDTDGDGVTDVYGTCSDATDSLQCMVSSTGKDFLAVDEDGIIYNNCKDKDVLSAMEFAADIYEKGYEMPKPEGAEADWYVSAFREGKAAMQFGEEALCKQDAPYGENNMTDEIGFVSLPKPDGQKDNYTYVYGNVWVIPSCYDEETAADIALAFNLYTVDTALREETETYTSPYEYDDYYSDFHREGKYDERAVKETLPRYNDEETANFLTRYLVAGLDIRDLTKNYPFTEKTPEECVDEVWDSWQGLIDVSNGGA